MRCAKPRRDSFPCLTAPIRRRISRSFMTCSLNPLSHFPVALAILQDACKSQSEQDATVPSMTAVVAKEGDGLATWFWRGLRDRLAGRAEARLDRPRARPWRRVAPMG